MKLNELFEKVTTYVKNVWNKLFNKQASIVEPSNPPKPTSKIVEPSNPPKP
jgi:hypothetical protein